MLESDRDISYIAKEGMEGILQELEQRIGNKREEVRTLRRRLQRENGRGGGKSGDRDRGKKGRGWRKKAFEKW